MKISTLIGLTAFLTLLGTASARALNNAQNPVPGSSAQVADTSRQDRPGRAESPATPAAQAPIHIKADRIEINQKKLTTVYIGRVSFTQGGLRIAAARAEASYRNDKVETVIASGSPVVLYQKSETPGQDLQVSALRLEYHALDNKADLFGQVRLQQGPNVMLSDTLHYDLTENILSAEGDGAGGRVSVTIEPGTAEKPATPHAVPGAPKRNRP